MADFFNEIAELCVSRFNDLGLELDPKLDRLDISRAAELTRETCSSPTSLVLALMYLDRLRSQNPKYLTTISSTDLFLVSLLVASKYLHDDGEEDEVFNDEWATSGNLEKKELNRMELEFLSAIDWNIYVSTQDYQETTEKLELAVVGKMVEKRPGSWTTYSDLNVLSRQLQMIKIWELLYEYTLKVTAVCAFAYAASLMTMLGTCHMLSHTTQLLKSSPRSQQIQLEHSNQEKPEERIRISPQEELDLSFDDLQSNETSTGCLFHTQEQIFLRDQLVSNRLTRALFALKLSGSFRDLMIGPTIASAFGHG